MEKFFEKTYNVLPKHEGDSEPMMNVIAWKKDDDFIAVVIPREKHRPDCYYATDEKQCLVSPGALDMADSVTGGGLHGKDLSKADVSVNIYAWLEAQRTGKPVELCCAAAKCCGMCRLRPSLQSFRSAASSAATVPCCAPSISMPITTVWQNR